MTAGEVKDYMWLVKTSKGNFFITVVGNWNEDEVAGKVHWVFEEALKLNIIAMIPRKRATGDMDNCCTIYEQLESKSGLGFEFMAGKNLWKACGRLAEYEAQRILLKDELKHSVG